MRLLSHLLLRALLVVAIVASAALLLDYSEVAEVGFCGHGSGCAAVKESAYSSILGIPVAAYGLGAYLGLFALCIWAETRRHLVALAVLASLGAIAAMVFIALQLFTIGAVCKWCMCVDVSGIVAAGVAWGLVKAGPLPESTPRRFAWSLLPAALYLVTLFWARHAVSSPLPEPLRALTVPGRVTLIEFTDFQCPFCRDLAEKMREIEAREPDRVAMVLVMNPLAIHPGAEPAARAYLCTPAEKQRDMAELLYKVQEDGLNRDATFVTAQILGLDPATFAACLDSPDTTAKLEAQQALHELTGVTGVPLTYVGRELILGNKPARVEEALARELSGGATGLPLWAMFLVDGGLFGLLALFTGWRPRQRQKRYAGSQAT